MKRIKLWVRKCLMWDSERFGLVNMKIFLFHPSRTTVPLGTKCSATWAFWAKSHMSEYFKTICPFTEGMKAVDSNIHWTSLIERVIVSISNDIVTNSFGVGTDWYWLKSHLSISLLWSHKHSKDFSGCLELYFGCFWLVGCK